MDQSEEENFYRAQNEDYDPLSKYIFYVMDKVSPQDLYDFESGRRDDIIIHSFDQNSIDLLCSFYFQSETTHYATTKENLKLHQIFLSNIGFDPNEKYLFEILVLLKTGEWGYKSKTNIWTRIVKETKKSVQGERKNILPVLELLEILSKKKADTDAYEYSTGVIKDFYPELVKVTFTFKDPDNDGKLKNLAFKTINDTRNPIANLIASYLEIQKDQKQFYKDLGFLTYLREYHVDEILSPHQLFCYRFIQFLENSTSQTVAKLGSRNKQFSIYIDLLKYAGFTTNSLGLKKFYGLESQIKKWYTEGQKLLKKDKI